MSFKLRRILLGATILIAAVVVAVFLTRMKPPPETRDLMSLDVLVEAMELEPSTAKFRVESQGTVQPRTETVLSAEVSGAIVDISPKFVAGGVFAKDEVLLRIDPTDYDVALKQAKALVRQRQIEFEGAEKLKSQGYRAEADYASAAAALASAKADLVRAERNLERTSIRLPYDGLVRAKEVDVGQYVGIGSRLGVVFATDYAEVRLPLTDSDLAFLDLPQPGQLGTEAEAEGPAVVLAADRGGQRTEWPAEITRTEGVVDEKNRVTWAVARIGDPYRLHDPDPAAVPLPMGTFVGASIEGVTVENLIRVPREALRGGNQLVFVDDESRLRIRDVDVLRTGTDYAWIAAGAAPGDRICLTPIESPVNGMHVRVEGAVAEAANDSAQVSAGAVAD